MRRTWKRVWARKGRTGGGLFDTASTRKIIKKIIMVEKNLEDHKNWTEKDWEEYTKQVNDSVRKPDPHKGWTKDQIIKEKHDNIRKKLYIMFLRLMIVAGGFWILSMNGLNALVPLMMLVGGNIALWEEEKNNKKYE